MIALYSFLPSYCPSCGHPTKLDRVDNPLHGKFEAYQTLICPMCGVKYQLATKTDLLRAATSRGGDLLEYFIDENGKSKRGKDSN